MNGIGTWVSPPQSLLGTSPGGTSSLPSSFQLDDSGILSNLSGHFEEIGLCDDHNERQTSKASSSSSSSSSSAGRQFQRSSTVPLTASSFRDLTVKRPPYPSLQAHVYQSQNNSTADHLGLPNASRRFFSPTSPGGAGRRSRNSSPGPSAVHAPNIPRSTVRSHTLPATLRRPTNRKTVDELEKEYDSDDEIPADMVFCNVPISHRAGKAVSSSSSPTEKNGVFTNGTTTPKMPPCSSSNRSSIDHPAFPEDEVRTKNWNHAVINGLSPEMRELTEKLEEHAVEEMAREEKRRQNTGRDKSRSRSRKPSLGRSNPIDLPPLQTTNGMIDPLPISKEKEAVLSRTRPSWLPPKSKKEEERHLKEYQKIMQLARSTERKKAEKEKKEQEQRDKLRFDMHRLWEKHIIPEWSDRIGRLETRELWWQGVAPKCRAIVWEKAIGNALAITEESFNLALKRARNAERDAKNNPSMKTTRDGEMFAAIRRDVNDTFPNLKIFQEQGPLNQHLTDLLLAYSMYRSDVGYVYGTHVIAAILLLNQGPIQAFRTLVNLLNRPVPLAFYTQDEAAMEKVYTLFLKAFHYKLPKLFQHIHANLKIPPPAYLEAMFSTLFSLHCPLDHTSRIWDVYVFEGDAFLVRTAIGVLTALEHRLYGNREEIVGMLGWRGGVWELGKEDDFLKVVRDAGKEERDVLFADRDG